MSNRLPPEDEPLTAAKLLGMPGLDPNNLTPEQKAEALAKVSKFLSESKSLPGKDGILARFCDGYSALVDAALSDAVEQELEWEQVAPIMSQSLLSAISIHLTHLVAIGQGTYHERHVQDVAKEATLLALDRLREKAIAEEAKQRPKTDPGLN